MYAVGDTLPVEELGSGSILISGPAMSGKYDLVIDLLVTGIRAGDAALFVTTNRGAEPVFEDVADRLGDEPDALWIVDCVSEGHGSDGAVPEGRVEHVSSPADLTGIGIAVSEQLRRIAGADVGGVRVGFYSFSTLLMYAELETAFRFLHVLTGRVDGIGGMGLFVLDPTTHDESTVSTLTQLFDSVVQTRDTDDGRQLRLLGVDGVDDGWTIRH